MKLLRARAWVQSSSRCGALVPRFGAAMLACVCLALASGCAESSAEVAASSQAGSGSAPVDARQRVRVHRVSQAPLESEDRASGIARAFHKARVTAEMAGRVVARRVERGAQVEAGQALIELDASRLKLELRRAEATLRARRHDLGHAERENERGKQMGASRAISEQRSDDLRHALDSAKDAVDLAIVARDTAQRNLEDATIRAPFGGRVDDLLADVGDYVAPGTPVATVVEMSRARVFSGVTAQQAALLSHSKRARVRFSALGGQEVAAELKSVSSVANDRDGTYMVELWIDEPPEDLRDGMVVTVDLPTEERASRPLAPRAALMRRAGQPEVFVIAREDGVAVARIRGLRTGRSSGDWIEVLEGLEAGEEVIVDGQFALRDGVAVTIDAGTGRSD